MLIEGFKFGMLLQLAIGPVCLYIFSLGVNESFIHTLFGVLGVVLADAMYIILAILGISSFIKNEKTQKSFNLLGGCIVIIFGLQLILGYFNLSILPSINLFKGFNSNLPFGKAFFLTAANPMTILFWIGVFSTKLNECSLSKKLILLFSIGSLLATLIFLSFIGFIGSLSNNFLNKNILSILNLSVGLTLVYFGIKKIKK